MTNKIFGSYFPLPGRGSLGLLAGKRLVACPHGAQPSSARWGNVRPPFHRLTTCGRGQSVQVLCVYCTVYCHPIVQVVIKLWLVVKEACHRTGTEQTEQMALRGHLSIHLFIYFSTPFSMYWVFIRFWEDLFVLLDYFIFLPITFQWVTVTVYADIDCWWAGPIPIPRK